MGGLVLAGVFVCRPGKTRAVSGMLLLAALMLGVPACGGGSSPSVNTKNVAQGTYTLTVVGTDTTTPSISGSTSLSVTVN